MPKKWQWNLGRENNHLEAENPARSTLRNFKRRIQSKVNRKILYSNRSALAQNDDRLPTCRCSSANKGTGETRLKKVISQPTQLPYQPSQESIANLFPDIWLKSQSHPSLGNRRKTKTRVRGLTYRSTCDYLSFGLIIAQLTKLTARIPLSEWSALLIRPVFFSKTISVRMWVSRFTILWTLTIQMRVYLNSGLTTAVQIS